MESVIKVQFFNPVNGKTEYYFGSLKAIYEQFTPEQIGCTVERLWASNITPDNPRATAKCVITKHSVIRKQQGK